MTNATKERLREILHSELKYLYLTSIISADSNYDEESITENIKRLEEIASVLEEDDDELKGFVEDGLLILNRDLDNWKKQGEI